MLSATIKRRFTFAIMSVLFMMISLPLTLLPRTAFAFAQSATASDCLGSAASGFLYVLEYQCFITGKEVGAYTKMTIEQPIVDNRDPSDHSLAEIAVVAKSPLRALEEGWAVAPGLFNGSKTPHLFVFPSFGSQDEKCWNACGWVQVSKTHYPGMELTPTSTPMQFGIYYNKGNWWVNFANDWMGYYPGNLWQNQGYFSSFTTAQWYGEVEYAGFIPCSQMGNGRTGPDPQSAQITDMGMINVDGSQSPAQAAPFISSSMYYDIGFTSANSFHYGGPGGTDC